MAFSEVTRERARQIIARYPEGRSRSALLPLLHLVQSEQGYVSPEGIAFCAEVLNITKAQVGAVATFYTMYKRKPTGDYLVSVCTNTMCGVLGGDKAFEALRDYLGVGHDETTSDGKITLEHAECLAACDYAPVMTVNYEFFDQITEDSALTLVKQLQNGERPQPTRGTRLCTLKEMAVQLAGFADDRGDDVIADCPAGEPTLAGNRLAERFGIAVPGFDPETPIAKKDEAPAKKPVETLPKAASDAKPAGDGPTPQKDAVKEAKA
jgi:NADH-quinone oxidoreductase subunit E